MNEKEIKAIELLKKIRFSSDEYYIVDGAYAKNIDYMLILNAIETVFNLIEKQKHIIEGKECVIETQAHNEEVLNKIIDEKQAEIEKQKELLELSGTVELRLSRKIVDLKAEVEYWKEQAQGYSDLSKQIKEEYEQRLEDYYNEE